MATFRNRSGKWQARVQTKGHASLSKTFINKADAERWAKQIEVEIQKGSYTNLVLAERSAKSEMFRYLTDIGNHCNMFYKEIKTRSRPPTGYAKLDLNDPEQMALAIQKTLPRK
jgi:hypothetical protein